MKHLLYTIVFLILTNAAIGQIKNQYSTLSYVTLTDSILINTIKHSLNIELNSDDSKNLFKKGFGYIAVHVVKYSQNDTLRVYYISPALLSIKEDSPNSLYPDFYSFVNNQLVVIYLDVLNKFAEKEYSNKEKKRIREMINKHLVKTKKVTFYDENEKKSFTDKHFRIDYFKFGGGYNVYIIKGKDPVIKEGKY